MYNVPFPPEGVGLASCAPPPPPNSTSPASVTRDTRAALEMARNMRGTPLGKHKIELTPVLLSRRTLGCPCGGVIELVGHLGWPETPEMTIEDVAFHGLAESGRAASPVGYPAWRERERASQGDMRRGLLGRSAAWTLKRDDVALCSEAVTVDRCVGLAHIPDHTHRFTADGPQMLHRLLPLGTSAHTK